MAIKTPDILPGEPGYIPKSERTKAKKEAERKEKKKIGRKEISIGKIKTGSKAYRIGRSKSTIKGEKKFPIWRYMKKIGEITIRNSGTPAEEIEISFNRLGGIGNFKHLIQDADFQVRWTNREQELLLTQDKCYLCNKKLSKTAIPNLYHTKMWQKRAQLLEEAQEVPEEVAKGKLTIEQGWEKFNDILESGNRYYMSLKDTALVCSTCAKSKGLKFD